MFKHCVSVISLCLISVSGISDVSADDIADRIEISGLLEGVTSFGLDHGGFEKAEFILTPELNLELSRSIRFTAIGRLRGDPVNELEPNRSHFSRQIVSGGDLDFELREAYIDTEIGNTFLRLGKQQVVWGQADGLKVLDVINPQSFREFILDDFDDSRIPLWMINAEIPIGATYLQVLWIPDLTYDDIPESGAAYAFTSPLIVPQVPAGVDVSLLSFARPTNFIGDSDIALKLSTFFKGWDVSLNYAYHYFDRPVVRRSISTSGINITQNYERTHLFGGTFSNVFGDVTLRGELGYSTDHYFLTDDLADTDGVVTSGEFSYVTGVDYQGFKDWFISAQFFQSIVTSPSINMTRDQVDSTGTFLVRRNFMNETLSAEALIIQSLNGGDGLVQTTLEYEWRSNVRFSLKADVLYGSSHGLFGQFNASDRISLGVEIGF